MLGVVISNCKAVFVRSTNRAIQVNRSNCTPDGSPIHPNNSDLKRSLMCTCHVYTILWSGRNTILPVLQCNGITCNGQNSYRAAFSKLQAERSDFWSILLSIWWWSYLSASRGWSSSQSTFRFLELVHLKRSFKRSWIYSNTIEDTVVIPVWAKQPFMRHCTWESNWNSHFYGATLTRI